MFDIIDLGAYKDLVNDTYACENDKTMNGILKGEFGFQGCEYFLILLVW